MKLSYIRNIIVSLLLFVLGMVVGSRYVQGTLPINFRIPFIAQDKQTTAMAKLTGVPQPADKQEVDFDVFWEAWAFLERDYLEPDKIEADKMVNGAIKGMTASLEDPYTIYLPPTDNKTSGENLNGKFYGVGIELGYIEQTLAVIAPLDGSPAAAAGLEAGDLILHVKDERKGIDEDTTDWSLDEAVSKIRGERGTEVTFEIYREGEADTQEISIIRDEIVMDAVTLEIKNIAGKRVAHLRVSKFGGQTQDQWDEAVRKILAEKNNLAGIALDFRNNPGGYFDTSIDLASDFIDNDVVVTEKGKYSKRDYKSTGRARLKDIPLVVLVNRGSASAAEIVAGALRDDLGAPLVGEKTFGKGTVQDRRELSNGGGLHITIGRWLLPGGEWIHDEGIPVDVEVEGNRDTEEDEVLIRAVEEL